MREIQLILQVWFNIDPNTSATIIITVIVFILGISIQQFIQLISNLRSRSRTRRVFRNALETHIKQVRRQSSGYLKTSETVKFDSNSPLEVMRATIFSASSFENIGFKETFLAYFFNKIWESIHSVDRWFIKANEDISYFLENSNRHNEKRNTAADNHRKVIDFLAATYNGKEVEKKLADYLVKLDAIHTQWQNLENATRPDILHTELIVPTRNLNNQHRDLEIAIRMNDNLLAASMEFQNQRNLVDATKVQFFRYSVSFKMYAMVMEKGMKILKASC
jgi:hypothetical protein